ncbi:hypothetical protein KQX54_002275 [Cotesia glomerata]|uniref:Uncharacterized protein n=1 Tax=Cotesia glomerata TaxID=32391 RepID=A0AAV7IC02_COTGL|nr:hypothetical protein KQX54_002275 [Cotesia glomerata]
MHPENPQSRVMNSTANPSVDPGNVSAVHVSGVPLAEPESVNGFSQVLQGVIQQLRAEIQAMRVAQQSLPPTFASNTSHTNTAPVNSNFPLDLFGNSCTFYPRELFPGLNAQPAPQPPPPGIPPYLYSPPQALSGAARLRATTSPTTATNSTSVQYSPTCTGCYVSASTEATGILLHPATSKVNVGTKISPSPITEQERLSSLYPRFEPTGLMLSSLRYN